MSAQPSPSIRDTGERVRVLVIDSSENGRGQLRSLLASVDKFDVIAEAASAEVARSEISRLSPDLVLMNVAMPDTGGIDLMRTIDSPPSFIVVTAHAQIAVPAFDVGAIDCLVRPVRQQRFVESMLRARRRITESRIASLALRIVTESEAVTRASGAVTHRQHAVYSSQLKIRIRRRVLWLSVSDIPWIQGASQYCRVHATSGEYLLARSLSALEGELDPGIFFRIHRSAIVNAAYVREIRTAGQGRHDIHLEGGPVLPMGRSRRETLRKLMEGVGYSARANARQ